MIFDGQIYDEQKRAEYHKLREDMGALLHDANAIVIDGFGFLTTLPQRVPKAPHASSILLARHVIEMVDGVGVLASKGCAEPCKPLLRSALEAVMGLIYIVKTDSDRRNIAYQVAYAHKQIKHNKKHDKNTPDGKILA